MRDFRWLTLASETNKNCSLPFVKVPDSIYADLQEPFNLPDGQALCVQGIDWHRETLQETSKGSGVFVANAPAAKKDGHWVGYYVELIFNDDT